MVRSVASEIARRLGQEAEAVCRHYLSNGRRQGRYWIVGNAANEKGRSLYVRLSGPDHGPGAAGKWTDAATGEHGDLLDLIAANCGCASLAEALEEARRFLSLPSPPRPKPADTSPAAGSTESSRRLFAMGRSILRTPAEAYLAARGITGLGDVEALRFHPRCYYWREDRPAGTPPETWPALIAKVTAPNGAITGLHRTWLDPVRTAKAPVEEPRKAMGRLLGNGVRLGRPDNALVIGEGLETMLSLRTILPGLPLVAALSANHLAALDLPGGLKRLYIAEDADEAGAMAAAAIEERISDPPDPMVIRLRPLCADFNADLRAIGRERFRHILLSRLDPEDAERWRKRR